MRGRGTGLILGIAAIAGIGCGDPDGAPVAGQDASVADTPPDASPPRKLGAIALFREPDIYPQMQLVGVFMIEVDEGDPIGRETVGPCTIVTRDPNARPSAFEWLDGGTLTATGPNGTLAAVADTNKVYDMTGPLIAAPGETVAFGFGGSASMPTFFDRELAAAGPVTVVSYPDPGDSVSRATDLEVTWTGGVASTVGLSLRQAPLDMTCTFDAAAQTGTIPTSVLSRFAPGQATFAGNVWTALDFELDGFNIHIDTQANLEDGDGTPIFFREITLE